MRQTPGALFGHWPAKDHSSYIEQTANRHTVDESVLLCAMANEHISIATIGHLVDANPSAVNSSVLELAVEHGRGSDVIKRLVDEMLAPDRGGVGNALDTAILVKALECSHDCETITVLINSLVASGRVDVVNEGTLLHAIKYSHSLATLVLLVETNRSNAIPDAVTPAVLKTALKQGVDNATMELLVGAHANTVDASVLVYALSLDQGVPGGTIELLAHASGGQFVNASVLTAALENKWDLDTLGMLAQLTPDAVTPAFLKTALKQGVDNATMELLVGAHANTVDASVLVYALSLDQGVPGGTIELLAHASGGQFVNASVLTTALENTWALDTLGMLAHANKAAVDASVLQHALKAGCTDAAIACLATADAVDASVLLCALQYDRDFKTMQLLVDANKDDDINAINAPVMKSALDSCDKKTIELLVVANNAAVDKSVLNRALELGCDLDTIEILTAANRKAVDTSVLVRALTEKSDFQIIEHLVQYTDAISAAAFTAVLESANHEHEANVKESKQCGICFEDLVKPYDYRDLPCHHRNYFHKECLDKQAKMPLNFDFVMEDGEEPDGAPPSQLCPHCRTPAGVDGGILALPVKTEGITNGHMFHALELLSKAEPKAVDATVLAFALRCGADFETISLLVDANDLAIDGTVLTAALVYDVDLATLTKLTNANPKAVDASILISALQQYVKYQRDYGMMQLLATANPDAIDASVLEYALKHKCGFDTIKLLAELNKSAVDAAALAAALEHGCDFESIQVMVLLNPSVFKESHLDALHSNWTVENLVFFFQQFPLPLHLAIRSRSNARVNGIVTALLRNGADPTKEDAHGITPLKAAAAEIRKIRGARLAEGAEWIAALQECEKAIGQATASHGGSAGKKRKAADQDTKPAKDAAKRVKSTGASGQEGQMEGPGEGAAPPGNVDGATNNDTSAGRNN